MGYEKLIRLSFLATCLIGAAHAQILAPIMAGSSSGSLSGSKDTTTASITLNNGSFTDWRLFEWNSGGGGCPGDVYDSATGGTDVPTYTLLGGLTSGNVAPTGSSPISYSFTGGTPGASSGSGSGACFISSNTVGYGFSITAPCGTASHTFIFYGMTFSGSLGYTFTAHLSDSSAADYVDSLTSIPSDPLIYTMTYKCASNGQTIKGSLVIASTGGGNLGIVGGSYN